jgi:hypothetical protein
MPPDGGDGVLEVRWKDMEQKSDRIADGTVVRRRDPTGVLR